MDEEGTAHYLTTTAVDDLAATPELPEPIEILLKGFGVEGIEVS